MPVYSFPAAAIADSTSTGRSLITAADAAAARSAIGIDLTDFAATNVSVSGNLDAEVGGSYRLFNLGSGDDVAAGNTEYLEAEAGTNIFSLYSKATGTGTVRELTVGNSTNRFRFTGSGVLCLVDSATKLNITTNFTYFYTPYVIPSGSVSLGRSANRWNSFYAVDGDFSGTVATSESFVINRTWNDAGTVFQAYDCNITDTASDTNSNLLNLKVSGVQKFRVKKDGTCTATAFVGDGSGLTGLPSGSSTLAGLTDTNVSSPANGQLLIYDAVSSKWDNAALTSTGGTIAFTSGAGTLNLETAGMGPSDERLKKDIKPIEGSLEKVMAMKPVEFEWRDGYDEFHKASGKDIGFVAQQIEPIEPLLVGERNEFLTLEYAKFAPLLVGAIQELQEEIERLKKKVGEL